uniref:Uncharacterized protein n=1 Tax=Ascaris lumbricoides TaxID=6252 RepID=A0A0M3IAF6_ASCLU
MSINAAGRSGCVGGCDAHLKQEKVEELFPTAQKVSMKEISISSFTKMKVNIINSDLKCLVER